MRLVAIRHGETEWNLERRTMGHLDSPLTALGVRQAEAVAERIARLDVAAIYTSDLGRAASTAAIIASRCGAPVTLEPALRERRLGIFQGLTATESLARHPAELAAFEREGEHYDIPRGETLGQKRERCLRALATMADRHDGQVIVAVTHDGVLRSWLSWVLGMPAENSARSLRDNCAYNVIEHRSGTWRIVVWNDTSHL
jgi:broad specificity phosphatase PhoE